MRTVLAQGLIDLLNPPQSRFLSVGMSSLIKSCTDTDKHQHSEVMEAQ